MPTGAVFRSEDSNGRPASVASSHKARKPNTKPGAGQGQGSWISSVINLVNTIVGAGVLAMPLAMSHMGIILGVIVILWAGATAGFGLYLQTRCARYIDRGAASFFALSQITYPRASVIFDAAIAIKCFGVGVSYLIIIGDLMPGVVEGISSNAGITGGYLVDRHFWVTAFMLIVIPFSFLRRIDSLKYTSVIALVSIGYLVILVLAHFIKGDTINQRGHINVVHWMGAIPSLSSLPVIIFAYTCHQNMFSVLNEMSDNSPQQTRSVVVASIGAAASIYVLVALTGYLSFGDNVGGNIVSMYIPSIASTIGKAAIVVLVMFSYALQVHPCRASVDAILKFFTRGRFSHLTSSRDLSPSRATLLVAGAKPPPPPKEMSETRFAAITTTIIVLSYVVAMTVSSLEKVLAYVGSTGSTSISFILPGLFFYKISAPDSPHQQRLMKEDDDEASAGSSGEEDDLIARDHASAQRRDLLRKLSLSLAVYGIVVMVVCLAMNTIFIVAQ